MKMRKFLSVALALCLVLCCLPMAAATAETDALEVKAWPGNTILQSGIYTIPADFTGTVTVNGNITVKLIGNAANTVDHPYTNLKVVCSYGNTALIIEDLNVNANSSSILAFSGTGNTLTLEGENTFNGAKYSSSALVQVNGAFYSNQNKAAELTINGTGVLNAFQPSDTYAAAIGGDAGAPCGKLTIDGGIINAVTQGNGAAIGGGAGGSAPSITVNAGTVNAECRYAPLTYSGYNQNLTGAAIGSGNGAEGGTNNITVNGGTVTAVTSTNSAAIGSGLYANGTQGSETTNITINGGKVMAFAEDNTDVIFTGGAAIGSSYFGGTANITVSGGEVVAVTRTAAAAIGSGSRALAATVTVNGGTVTAFGNGQYDSPTYKGPAIGCGCYATPGNIIIDAGAVLGVGTAEKNIHGNISNSQGAALTEVSLNIPGIESLTIDGTDWKVSANHADLSGHGGYDFSEEVHIWLPAYDGAADMIAVTENSTKYYDLWANGTANEYHTVTYDLSSGLQADGAEKVYDPISAPSWNEDLEGTLSVTGDAGCYKLPEYITVTVSGEEVTCDYDPRTGEFLVAGDLLTGDVVISAESVLKHDWEEADCDHPKTCPDCGTTQGEALGHDYQDGYCTRCGAADPEHIAPVTRIFGDNRFTTAFKVADELKAVLGVQKFDTIIIASGTNFADALSGSYLAAQKNAPILLSYNEKYDQLAADYIRANLKENGTVYILGGDAAVSATMESKLSGLKVKRLAGANRFETNILILKEAGVTVDETLLVCTGTDFADCLSASATGMPILLVWNDSGKLMDCQKAFLDTLYAQVDGQFLVVGGTSAVSTSMEKLFRLYGITDRISGANRFETSAALAEHCFGDTADQAVLAYAWNYPDGLCGGPLANAMNAPLVLTMTGYEAAATAYIADAGIENGIVLGGEKLISDASIRAIFALAASAEIPVK